MGAGIGRGGGGHSFFSRRPRRYTQHLPCANPAHQTCVCRGGVEDILFFSRRPRRFTQNLPCATPAHQTCVCRGGAEIHSFFSRRPRRFTQNLSCANPAYQICEVSGPTFFHWFHPSGHALCGLGSTCPVQTPRIKSAFVGEVGRTFFFLPQTSQNLSCKIPAHQICVNLRGQRANVFSLISPLRPCVVRIRQYLSCANPAHQICVNLRGQRANFFSLVSPLRPCVVRIRQHLSYANPAYQICVCRGGGETFFFLPQISQNLSCKIPAHQICVCLRGQRAKLFFTDFAPPAMRCADWAASVRCNPRTSNLRLSAGSAGRTFFSLISPLRPSGAVCR